jgi:hypothetical protein
MPGGPYFKMPWQKIHKVFAKAAAIRPRIVGEALKQVAADAEVEAAMFEILEVQKIVESKARVTRIPEKSTILPELLAAGARTNDFSIPLPPTRPKTS